MDYDFIEIGTCDFNTEIQKATDTTVGLSIEPLKHYLDALPNKPNVTKVNCAISKDGTNGEIDIYHIPKEISAQHKLKEKTGHDFVGSSAVGDYHWIQKKHGVEHLVQIDTVPCRSIESIFDEENVESCKFLKVDAEGFDSFIVHALFDYLSTKPTSMYPKKIQFEANETCDVDNVKQLINRCSDINYDIVQHSSYVTKIPGKWIPDYILHLRASED